MVESIFDDNTNEVGAETEAYCPSSRCKADTTHLIISMYEAEIRRVRCLVCGEVHAYRKPKGTEEDDETVDQPLKTRLKAKPSWEEAMRQVNEKDLDSCRVYSVRDTYQELDIVSHPSFGLGFVTEVLADNKVEVMFRDHKKILIHGRGDLATKVPNKIAELPIPRGGGKRRRRRKNGEESTELKQAMQSAQRAREAAQQLLRAERDKLNKEAATQKLLKNRGNGPAKSSAKKTAAEKKASGPKATAKKASAPKAAPKEAPPKKAQAKKTTAQKAPAKKMTTKKSTAKKKAPAKKTSTKKPAAKKKAPAKKTSTKKPAAKKKAPAKKTSTKKPAAKKKAPAKKTTTKKSTAKKKAPAKKTTTKKSTAKKKAPAKKSSTKKSTAQKKTSAKKSSTGRKSR